MCACVLNSFGHVRLCDSTDGSHQAPLSMGFSRQEYWSGLPCPSGRSLQGIFQTQRSNPHFLCLLHWQVGSLLPVPPGKSLKCVYCSSSLFTLCWSKKVMWPNPVIGQEGYSSFWKHGESSPAVLGTGSFEQWYHVHARGCSVAKSCWTLCNPMGQTPLPMGFSKQEYWSGLPFPPPRDL